MMEESGSGNPEAAAARDLPNGGAWTTQLGGGGACSSRDGSSGGGRRLSGFFLNFGTQTLHKLYKCGASMILIHTMNY